MSSWVSVLEPVIVPDLDPVIVPDLDPVIVPDLDPVIVPDLDPVIVPVLEPVIVPAVATPERLSAITEAAVNFCSRFIFSLLVNSMFTRLLARMGI
jgi:hypothetical protein